MSIGNTLGRAIGYTAAAAVHGACATASATGRFGQDLMVGTTEAYSEHSERLALARAAVARARESGIAIETVTVAPRRQRATA